MPSIAETIGYIKGAHAGQFDKGGRPYWEHPVSVMYRLPADATDEEKQVALLHDVLEDTDITTSDLLAAGYSIAVVTNVNRLTRKPNGPDYLDWIRSIAASGNRAAIRVKIADNEDNSDPARCDYLNDIDKERTKRYARSLAILRPALAALDSQKVAA